MMQRFYACVGIGQKSSNGATDGFVAKKVPVDLLLAFAKYLREYPAFEESIDRSTLESALAVKWDKLAETQGQHFSAGVKITESIPISFKPPVWELPPGQIDARNYVHPYFVISEDNEIPVAEYKKEASLGEFYCHEQTATPENTTVGLIAYIDEDIQNR